MNRFRSLLFIAAIALSSSARAATVTYTLTGDGASIGALEDTGFADFTFTSFTITATADTSTIQNGLSLSTYPATFNPVTASIQFSTPSGLLNLTTSTSVWSLEYDSKFHYGFSAVSGFDSFFFQNGLTTSDIVRSNLAASSTSSGTYGTFSLLGPAQFSTERGLLIFHVQPGDTGTFTVTAVPEPATATSSLLLSLAGLSLISRRNRKA